jgi:hypothetical protein
VKELIDNVRLSSARLAGGQAQVYICDKWVNQPMASASGTHEHIIPTNAPVAIKLLQVPKGNGELLDINSKQLFERAREAATSPGPCLPARLTARPTIIYLTPPLTPACLPTWLPAEWECERALHKELELLGILHQGGCGDRVIEPVGLVRWPGQWKPELVGKEWIQVSVALVLTACCLVADAERPMFDHAWPV